MVQRKMLREREREREPHGEAKPPNLLVIAPGLLLFLSFLPFLACVLEVVLLLQACTCNKKRKHKASRQA